MYQSIKVERAKVAPITSLTITFDPATLQQFESFLNDVRVVAVGKTHEYAYKMLNNIFAMKGY